MNFINNVLVFVSLFFSTIASNITCLGPSSCRNGLMICAFCIGSPDSMCFFPYEGMYEEEPGFFCKSTLCSNMGCVQGAYVCLSDYNEERDSRDKGFPSTCVCSDGYYGEKCETKIPPGQHRLSGVSLTQNDHFPGEEKVLKIRLFATTTRAFESLVWTLEAPAVGNGFFIERATERCTESSGCEWKDIGLYKVLEFTFKNRLSFVPYTSNSNLLIHRDWIYGYMASVRVRVVHSTDDTLIYDQQHLLFVNYEGAHYYPVKCIAVFTLNNCGVTPSGAVTMHRFAGLKITSDVRYMDDGQRVSTSVPMPECGADSINYVWKIWRIDSNAIHSFEYLTPPLIENHTNKTLEFTPFSMELGKYKVLHEIRHVGIFGTSLNYQYCYFNVDTLPLVAQIYGGTERKVFKPFGVILKWRAHDPNEPEDRQGHLISEFNCSRLSGINPSPCRFEKIRVGKTYRIDSSGLDYGAVYNFTLKVSTDKYDKCNNCKKVGPQYAHVVIKVAEKNEKTPAMPSLEIECVQNCGELVVPNSILYLRVKYSPAVLNASFEWKYMKQGEAKKPMNLAILTNIHQSQLIINEDLLEPDTSYTIMVTEKGLDWYVNYMIRTDVLLYNGDCMVMPETGMEGLDLFDINCTRSELHLRYEFYDKSSTEVATGLIFNGRMLGTSTTGLIRNVRLTRDHVKVYIYNDRGLTVTKDIKVTLKKLALDDKLKKQILNELQETVKMGNVADILGYVSVIPDIFPADQRKPQDAYTLMNTFKSVGMSSDLGDLKLWISSMSNVLYSLNHPTPLVLDVDVMHNTLREISKRAESLRDTFFRGGYATGWMAPKQVKTLSRCILNCVNAVIKSKNVDLVGADDDNTDKYTLEKLRMGSEYAENTLYGLKDVISFMQSRGQPPTQVATDDKEIVIWVMKHDEVYSIVRMLEHYIDIPINISKQLMTNLESRVWSGEDLMFQVAHLQNNLFWWDMSNIQSSLTSVSVNRELKGRYVRKIKVLASPLKVLLTVTNKTSNAVRSNGRIVVDPAGNIDAQDDSVMVHRLDLKPRTLININFLYPPTTTSLRVVISTTIRPDIEMMVKDAVVINETSKNVKKYFDTLEPTFVYIGIIPGVEVPDKEIVEYSFEVAASLCQTWAHGSWTSEGCRISHEEESLASGHVACLCQHFSLFAAAFPVPPQEVDPFADAKLFLTVIDNPLVVTFVTGILIIFLILCCVMRFYFRHKDEELKKLILLEDNFPEDHHPYLIAVLTGSRFNAGTTAHVGLQFHGEKSDSRKHILTSKRRKTLRRGSEDWFVMFCPQNMGIINCIHLWHDNYGSSPEWFCAKIYLYDLEANMETQFVIEFWLALRPNCFPEALVRPAKRGDILSFKRTFLENFIFAMREGHMFMSILMRHQRSKISRMQRLGLIMDCIMVAMLCSIMFFQPQESAVAIDDSEYSIGTREIIVSVQSACISIVITSIVLLLFRLSYKTVEIPESRPTLVLRDSPKDYKVFYPEELRQRHPNSIDSENSTALKSTKSNMNYKNFVRIVSKALKTQTLRPVQTPSSPPAIKVRWAIYFIAWTVCLSVISCCAYLVMLYGLKLGPVSSQQWLSSVLMAVGEEIVIVGPIRLVTAALILSLAHRKMFEAFCHCVTVKEALELRSPNEKGDNLLHLLIKRSHPTYKPLSDATTRTMLHRQQVRNNWWTMVDIIIGVTFLVVLNQLVFNMWTSNYHANNNADQLITNNHPIHPSLDPEVIRPAFHDIVNIPVCESYLHNTFLDAILKLTWYNKDSLKSTGFDNKYWAADSVSRLMGYPQVRQQRVVPKECVNLIGLRGICVPNWSTRDMDTDLYSTEWKPATLGDSISADNPWRYTEHVTRSLVALYRLYGASGRVYDSGGYLQSVPSDSVQRARFKVGKLKRFGWQDVYTRALFVELTLYNVNTDIFSQVTLIVEYIVSGATLTLSRPTSVDAQLRYNVWYFLFILFVLYYILRLGCLVSRHGLLEFLEDLNSKCLLAIVVLGSATVVLAFLHHFHCTSYVKEFVYTGQQKYFDFDIFYQYFPYIQCTLSLIVAVSIIRILKLLTLIRPLLLIFYTFVISSRCIFWLTIVMLMLYSILQTSANVINISMSASLEDNHFIKLKDCFETFLHGYATLNYFLALKMAVRFSLVTLYIVLFAYYKKIAKTYKGPENFDFVKFSRKHVTKHTKR